jgi:hypothetical protein
MHLSAAGGEMDGNKGAKVPFYVSSGSPSYTSVIRIVLRKKRDP